MKRIQRKRTRGWRMPENCVYVGRPTKWGNPFKVATASEIKAEGYWGFLMPRNVEQVLILFKRHARRKIEIGELQIDDLRGKDLCCWCPLCEKHRDGKPLDEHCPDCSPCHVDVIGQLLELCK